MIRQMPFDQYVAIDAVNWSRLSQMRRSPMHCRASRDATPAMVLGTAAHSLLLQPEEFEARYLVGPSGALNRNPAAAEWRACKAEAAETGREAISGDDWQALQTMRERVWSHEAARRLLEASVAAEAVVTWDEDGTACKARVDAYTPAVVLDIKTTRDASIDAMQRALATYGYHGQLAWYMRGLRANAVAVDAAAIIAIETEPPFAVAVYEIEAEALAQGRREADCWLAVWRRCVETGEWPGYSGVDVIGLPKWAQDDRYNEETTP